MRAVVQRVKYATVKVNGESVSRIGGGLLVFVGICTNDGDSDINYIAEKVSGLRIFEDDSDKMNRSVLEVGGSVLLVSQFTLYGDARKGRRPNFMDSCHADKAKPLYEKLAGEIASKGIPVSTGIFQAYMEVSLVNDGPVTILLDSKKTF